METKQILQEILEEVKIINKKLDAPTSSSSDLTEHVLNEITKRMKANQSLSSMDLSVK